MDTACKLCGREYDLRDGHDPTPTCDDCAHTLVQRLGNALLEQSERWGLYGNDSQQALEEFKKLT